MKQRPTKSDLIRKTITKKTYVVSRYYFSKAVNLPKRERIFNTVLLNNGDIMFDVVIDTMSDIQKELKIKTPVTEALYDKWKEAKKHDVYAQNQTFLQWKITNGY